MISVNKAILMCGSWLFFLAAQAGAQQSYLPAGTFWSDSGDQEARAEEAYQKGTRALDEQQWNAALEAFNEVVKLKSSRIDAALYWTAYAQSKLRQYAAALQTLENLRKTYAGSRWLNDAKALELEARQASGQAVTPESQPDEDLKLMALNGLQNSDPERAIPLLEKFLSGNNSRRLKERALFVLAQSDSQQARDLLLRIAQGKTNPDLQMKALNYLGLFGGKASKQALADIYASSTDNAVRKQILRSFMVGGDKDRLLAAAKGEKTPELRAEAVRQLGVLGATDSLAQLYQTETATDIKETILHALMVGGGSDKLIELARGEKDPKLRISAIHMLGVMSSQKTSDTLVSIY